jgi:hypothetical protein
MTGASGAGADADAPPAAAAFGDHGSNVLVRAGAPGGLRTSVRPCGGDDDAGCERPGGVVPICGGVSEVHEVDTPLWHGVVRAVFRQPPAGAQQAPDAAALLDGRRRNVWIMFQASAARVGGVRALARGACHVGRALAATRPA